MGKLLDQYKIQIKNYRKFKGQQRNLRTFPRCSSDSVEVVVMNSLDPIKRIRTRIVEIGRFGRQGYSHVVTRIKCPECGNILEVDKRWLGFICTNHKKRIWEVVEVYEKNGKRFK